MFLFVVCWFSQGSEYTSDAYTCYVRNQGIILSFADKASPWQNGFQESFYGKFTGDLGDVNRFETVGELIEAIYQTIYYYNNKRRHSSLKNISPIQFKENYYSKKQALERLSKELGTVI